MENSLLETTWQLLQLSLASCHISMIHIARYAHRWERWQPASRELQNQLKLFLVPFKL